ncbi:MAG: FHA domain-containing protein [Anaerolineales bacterium]|nr:FHA domain-containing protein [Anaerolineales bacterium]
MASTDNLELIITGPDTEMVLPLAAGVYVLGRVPGVDIQLDHPRILRRHLRLEISDKGIQITPLNRRSHTQVNDEDIPAEIPAAVKPGDRIAVGPFILMIVGAGDSEPAAPEPDDSAEEVELVAASGAGGGAPPPTAMPDYLRQAPLPPPDYSDRIPDGLGRHSVKYMRYLPHIFHDDFTSRFIGLIEALYMPMQWNVDNFDLFLDPMTAPTYFLDWIAGWFGLRFDHTWSEEQRRTLLAEANTLFAQRGSKRALSRLLEIYTGRTPEIHDLQEDQDPFTFTVRLPMRERDTNRTLLEQLIEANKPTHTSYILEFSGQLDLDVVYSKLDFGD